MKRLTLLVLTIFIMLNLTGCTQEASRIYTVCKIDNGNTYCYDYDNNFYIVSAEDKLIKCNEVGLIARPTLSFVPSGTEYKIESTDVPNCYKGTFESLKGYVYTLLNELEETSFEIKQVDSKSIEIFVYSSSVNTRCIYNIYGELRLYCIDENSEACDPIFLD